MVVEYCPSDIVSVPNECDYGKLRVCRYTVIAEHESRTKLNDGAFEHNSKWRADLYNLFNWLDTRIHGHDGFVTYTDVKQAFPKISMHDIKKAIEDYSEYNLDCKFDHHSNDYEISFQSLPV
jgi:hypothetical protein